MVGENQSAWGSYIEKTKELNKGPRILLVEALKLTSKRNSALDLGAGALNDTKYLLDQSFRKVTAVDQDEKSKEIAKELSDDRLIFIEGKIEEFEFPDDTYDLINAQFSLPFIDTNKIEEVLAKIAGSLIEEGVFVGQLFGERDEWSKRENINFHTVDKIRVMLKNVEILKLEEEEKEGATVEGAYKHWHIIHIIFRKRREAAID